MGIEYDIDWFLILGLGGSLDGLDFCLGCSLGASSYGCQPSWSSIVFLFLCSSHKFGGNFFQNTSQTSGTLITLLHNHLLSVYRLSLSQKPRTRENNHGRRFWRLDLGLEPVISLYGRRRV